VLSCPWVIRRLVPECFQSIWWLPSL